MLVSCGSGNNPDGSSADTFTDDSFTHVKLHYSSGEKIYKDTVGLFRANILRYHPEGFLLIADMHEGRQLTVTDLKKGTTRRYVNTGRSANEIINVRDISVQGKEIYISSMMESKILKLGYSEKDRSFHKDTSFRFDGIQFMRSVPLQDSFLTLSSASSGNRMNIVSTKGNITDTVGIFPKEGITGIPNNAVIQSDLCVSPDGRHIAVACRNIDYIDIYDSSFNLNKRLRGPECIDIEIKKEELGMAVRFTQSPVCFMYDNIVADNNYFMAGYNGKILKEGEIPSLKGFSTIYSFKWDGTPLKAYTFDIPIISFDFDPENGIIYCIANKDDNQEIISFRL